MIQNTCLSTWRRISVATEATIACFTTGKLLIVIRKIQLIIKNIYISGSGNILSAHRIVPAIGQHVIAQDALAGTYKCIRVEESAPGGVIVAGLEIIEACFFAALVAMGPVLTAFYRVTPHKT